MIIAYLLIRRPNAKCLFINENGDNLVDKTKIICISVGIVIMLVCLVSFSHSKSPYELFTSSFGMMAIIYGFFWDDKKVNETPTNYSPVSRNSVFYHVNKKLSVTVNYFLAMSLVFFFQWLFWIYIFLIRQIHVEEDVISVFMFNFLLTFSFFIQIRESDIKYIGKRRK